MTMMLIPERLAEPPPDFTLDLVDGEIPIGWITPRTIAFQGFASDTEAAHAAWAAHRTLSWRLVARSGGRPMPVDVEPLTLHHADDGLFVRASGKRFAELVPPSATRETWAFVLALPDALPELFVRSKANAIYRMLRRSGIRWNLWQVANRPRLRTRR